MRCRSKLEGRPDGTGQGGAPGGASAAVSQPAGMLGHVGGWPRGEVLGLDFETTGVDRFNDVPVSYALVSVVEGVVVRSWSGLIDPGREIPSEATAVHGIPTERAQAEGMPLRAAIGLVSDAVVSASARGVPLAGMKLDYDLTILETQARDLWGAGPVERGWSGPVLDAGVIDRHVDPDRPGRRTLSDLCAHYGIEIRHAHDAAADATAAIEVIFALAVRHEALWQSDLARLHNDQIAWHLEWTQRYESWRLAEGMIPIDPRDSVWPVAPAVLPAA
jgi:DNA polymerase III subunit epsilon